MTVTWYVDDLRVPHKNPVEIAKLALCLSKIYGKVTVKRQKLMTIKK